MGKKYLILLSFTLLLANAFAADHFNVLFTSKGIYNLLSKALEYNNLGSAEHSKVVIPSDLYKQKIPMQDLKSNEVVSILNRLTDFNFNQDYYFYLKNNKITIKGSSYEDDIHFDLIESSSKGFTVDITAKVSKLKLYTSKIQICEKANRAKTACLRDGLMATFKNINVRQTSSSKIEVKARLRADIINGSAKFRVISSKSNIERIKPRFSIDFDLELPPVVVTVDGESFEMDTSNTRDLILSKKDFLLHKLLAFASDYIAQDLVVMLNKSISSYKVPVSYGQNLVTPNYSYDNAFDYPTTAVDNTYVAPRYYYPKFSDPALPSFGEKKEPSFMDEIISQLNSITRQASFKVELNDISKPFDRAMDISLEGQFKLNYQTWKIVNKLSNDSRKYLGSQRYTKRPNTFDVGLSISEPQINAALKLAVDDGMLQDLMRRNADGTSGVYIEGLHMHVKAASGSGYDKIYAVANLRINIYEIESDGIGGWFEKKIGGLLEQSRSGGNVYLPLQFEIIPEVKTMPGGELKLFVKATKPISSDGTPKNYFGYRNDVASGEMTGLVEDAVKDKLIDLFDMDAFSKTHEVPLKDMLSAVGIELVPIDLNVEPSGHIVIYVKIGAMDFGFLNAKKVN